MTQEKEIHFTGYEHQISTWRDLNPAERFTLLILQQLAKVSKDPRGTYITNERLASMVGLHPNRISSTITKLKKKGYITVQRVGATRRYIKTRDYNHRTKTYTTDEQVKGIMKYVNALLDNNPHNKVEIEEVDDTYSFEGLSENEKLMFWKAQDVLTYHGDDKEIQNVLEALMKSFTVRPF